MDSVVCFVNTCPLDRDLNNWGLIIKEGWSESKALLKSVDKILTVCWLSHANFHASIRLISGP